MTTFTRYSNISEEQKAKILSEFEHYELTAPLGDVGHAAACIARSVFEFSNRQWSGKNGNDAFAATLAVLAMSGKVKLELPVDNNEAS